MANFKMYRNGKRFDAVREELKLLDQFTIKVGFPQGEPVGNPREEGSGRVPFKNMGEVASIALVNDTARPFLSEGIEEGKKKIAAAYLRAARIIADGNLTAEAGAAMVGEAAAGVVRLYIRDHEHEPINAATAARKGSTKPLIDTGQLINSVTFKVD